MTGKITAAVSACLLASSLTAWAVTVPFTDDFESYTNQAPLVGLNGWYASDTNCIVQTNVSYTRYGGTKSAQIPLDVTLSNRLTGVGVTSIWTRFYSRAVFFNGSTNGSDFAVTNGVQPVVDTNLSAMFFINTAGYFVVHNGPVAPFDNPTNSTKWVTITNKAAGSAATPIVAGAWTRVEVLLDYPNTNWSLYANGDKLTNNLGFINTNIASFTSFDTYNGGSTTYLDNVYITASKTLTIDGLMAFNKYYDGNANASLNTNYLTLVGVDGSDVVNLDINAATAGVFENKSVGERKTVTVTGLTISGANAGGYSLVTNTYASIIAQPLTLSGLAVSNKIYDGTTVAAISSTGTLSGIVGAETCYLDTNSMSASFDTKTVGAGKTVTVTGLALSGTDNTNYSIANHYFVNADITVNSYALHLDNLKAAGKFYDGNSNATITSYGTLTGKMGSDAVTLNWNPASAYFEDKNAGSDKTVTLSGLLLNGADAPNYTISNQTTTANITNAPLTITADDKSKGWGTPDPVFTASYATFVGGENSSVISGLQIGRDGNEAIGTYTITPSNAVAGNYAISYVNGTFTITKASRTVTFTPNSPQMYNTSQDLSTNVLVTPGTGTWTFTVQSGPGQIVDGTNLLMKAGYGTVTVRASTSGDATNSDGYADAYVVATNNITYPETNSIPWYDDFEAYGVQAQLINGFKGWYGSSSNIIVQADTVRTGTRAAMIPADCVLSNLFVTNTPSVNVWMQMDVMLPIYDGQTNNNGIPYAFYPVVDTNAALMFFVNTNGQFVVHNGPATNTSPTNSQSWVVATNGTITNTGTTWVRINIYEDFANTNCDLYANGALVTNNIRFINTNLTNFAGFDIYNGATTTYLDNCSVVVATNNMLLPLIVVPSALSTDVFVRAEEPDVPPADQIVRVINVWPDPVGFQVRTNQWWVRASLTNGIVAPESVTTVTLSYASTTNWSAGVSNATVTVIATNGTAYWGTQTVQVAINMIALSNAFSVVPTSLSNDVWFGATPTSQTFEVRNPGNLSLNYTVTTSPVPCWITCSNTVGTLAALSTNTITNTYESTAGWPIGLRNAYVHVVASNGGFMATQTVDVAVNVMSVSDVIGVYPASLINSAWRGDIPSNQTFVVSNKSDASFVYNVTTQATAGWITSLPTGGTLAAHSGSIITQKYGSTLTWQGLSSSSWVKVASPDIIGGGTQQVDVTVNMMDFEGAMVVNPLGFTNTAWVGDTPTSRTFTVANIGNQWFVFRAATSPVPCWITGSPTGATVAAKSTNTVTLTYRPTWGWTPGTSNAMAIVSSVNGIGSTQNVAVTLLVLPPATNYYVATNGTDNNASPCVYTNWLSAASNLTSAVYRANFYTNIASVVWLSNGLYKLQNQVTLSNVTVRSVNGAEKVTLNGGAMRGFQLVHPGAALNGLTITNCNAGTGTNGGAVFVSTGLVVNCRLLMNSAPNGGGVAVNAGGVVRDCLIWGNRASGNGGGVYYDMAGRISGPSSGLVESCTIASNYAALLGGGLYTATNMTGVCVNAVVYSNTVGSVTLSTNWGTNTTARLLFTNSCVTTPDVVNGVNGANNITNNPLFLNVVTGDCRLVRASPCFNAGTNQAWMVNALDLAGSLRIRFGRVDIGAYEWYPYQGMGIKVNGVPYEKIKLINGAEPIQIDGIPSVP